jgi:hypothetical protein
MAVGVRPRHRHQTKIIRTCSRLGMGSDYFFALLEVLAGRVRRMMCLRRISAARCEIATPSCGTVRNDTVSLRPCVIPRLVSTPRKNSVILSKRRSRAVEGSALEVAAPAVPDAITSASVFDHRLRFWEAPLCKGSCQPVRLTEGLPLKISIFWQAQCPRAAQQSLRHGFAVPPPFTQGRLWRGTQASLYHEHPRRGRVSQANSSKTPLAAIEV